MKKKYSVPKSAITEAALIKLIKKASSMHGSIGEWARHHSITPQSVSAFLLKKQGAGIKIPQILGYRPQLVFIPIGDPLIQELPAPRRKTDRPTAKVDHTKPPVEKRSAIAESIKKRNKKKKRSK